MLLKDKLIKNKKCLLTIIAIIILIIVLLMISYYQLNVTEKNYLVGHVLDEKEYKINRLSDLPVGSIIIQEFTARYNNLEKINLNASIDKNVEDLEGAIKVILMNENKEVIAEQIIDYNTLSIKSDFELTFDKQSDSKGKKYSINIILDKGVQATNKEKSIVSFMDSKNRIDKFDLVINGKQIDGSILIIDKYCNQSRTLLFNLTAIGISIISLGISIFLYTRKKLSVEGAFLIVVPIICILFLIYVPMFLNHDEYRHWLRTYEISEGVIIPKSCEGTVGTELPSSVSKIFTNQKHFSNIKYNTIKDFINEEIDVEDRTFVDTSRVATYSPIQYLPQVIGVTIAKLLTNKTIIIAYAARIANMIVSLTIMYFAIKTIPFGKMIFLTLSLIPIVIEGFTGITADGLIISTACLFIAYILKLRFNDTEKIKLKDKIILLILMIIISLCKTVYIPFFLLLLILPKSIFNSSKEKWWTIILISLISIALNFTWIIVANTNLNQNNENIATQFKVNGILENPIVFLQRLVYSLNVNGQTYLNTTYGGQLGWTETKTYFIAPFGLFIISLISCICDRKLKNKLKKSEIINFALIVLGVVGAVFLALYTTWTDVKSNTIDGVQGRYFLPILPLLLLIIGSIIKIESKYKERNIIKFISILGIILYINSILTIVITYLN